MAVAARLAGAFANVGCAVAALYPSGHVLSKSRHVTERFAYRAFFVQSCLSRAIARFAPDLVVPCDDRAAMHLLAAWSLARAHGNHSVASLIERSLGTPSVYRLLVSRASFIETAGALGVQTPETRRVRDEECLTARLCEIGLPAVLKVDGTWGGDGVIVARTPKEARTAFRRLGRLPSLPRSLYRAVARRDEHHVVAAIKRESARVNIQGYVHGSPATSSFACWQGRVTAAIHFDVVVASDPHGPASVLRRIDDTDMSEAVTRIARHFQLSGLHGLDFVRDAQGAVRLIEINPRSTPTAHLALGEGGDLIASLVSALTSAEVKARPAVTGKNTIALFPQEWTRDPQSTHLRDAHHDLPTDDPETLQILLSVQAVRGHGTARPLVGAIAER